MTPIAALITWGSSFVQPKPQEKNGNESTHKDAIPESHPDSNFLLEPSRCRLVEHIGGIKDLKAQQAWWYKKLRAIKGVQEVTNYLLPQNLVMILNDEPTQTTFDEIRKIVNPTLISLEYNCLKTESDLTLPNFEHFDQLKSISVRAKEVKNLDSLASSSITSLTLNSPKAEIKFSEAWKHNHTLENLSITADKIEIDVLASCPLTTLNLWEGEVKFSEAWKHNQTLTSLSLDKETKLDCSVWNLMNLKYIYHINDHLVAATTPALCNLSKLHKTCRWLIHNRLAYYDFPNSTPDLLTLVRNWAEKELDPQAKAAYHYPTQGYSHNLNSIHPGGVCYTAPFEESAVHPDELESRIVNLKNETNPSTIQINTVERGLRADQGVKDQFRLHFTVQLTNETFYKYFESYFLSYFHSPAQGETFQKNTLKALLPQFKETAAFKKFCALYGEEAATKSFQEGKTWFYEVTSKGGTQTILDIKGAWYDPTNKQFTIAKRKTYRSDGIHLFGHA